MTSPRPRSARPTTRTPQGASSTAQRKVSVNEVHLVGRVSGEPTDRELPSGDRMVALRVVLRRPTPDRRAGGVDTIDLACWSATTRRTALRLRPGQWVEVHGELRRRFFRAGGAPASRYEVEVRSMRRT